jgi:PRC-barrel domain
MPDIDSETLDRWRELVVVDRDGSSVGTISEFYLDRESGQATWALINSGLLGSRHTFVPLTGAVESAGALRVPFSKRQVTTAPGIDPDGELTSQEEAVLFAHYGMQYRAASAPPAGVDQARDQRAGLIDPRRLTRRPRPGS